MKWKVFFRCNSHLKNDGFQIVEKMRYFGEAHFCRSLYRRCNNSWTRSGALRGFSGGRAYVSQQITRMDSAVESDPALAIGTAKELLETCCKTILNDSEVVVPDKLELAQLVKLTTKQLKLTPQDIPERPKAGETIKRLLSNLASITQGITELRNQYGTGHGKDAKSKGSTEARKTGCRCCFHSGCISYGNSQCPSSRPDLNSKL